MTPREHDAFVFIRAFIVRNGYSPSMQEIADGLGLKSKNGAYRLVRGLNKLGYIKHVPHKSRGIVLKDGGA